MSDSEKNLNPLLNIINKIKQNKKLQYFLIAVMFLAVAIFVCLGLEKSQANTSESDEITSYIQTLENKLSNTLSSVDGAGKVSVVITVESGMETVLAMETTTKETTGGKTITEIPVIVNGKTVVVKELYPKISGVLVVAEGAKNISVLTKIQQAIISLLDINLNQIEILSMK